MAVAIAVTFELVVTVLAIAELLIFMAVVSGGFPDQGIPSRIHVSVMQFTTTAAYPESHNQPVNPSRTPQGSAMRTGDGGVSLVRDFKASGRVLALSHG
jgi:acyl-coenzyme A synthetase/AMP-(fatty) acid ligase